MRSGASHLKPEPAYSSMPLLRLVELIAYKGDRLALDQIHQRTPCQIDEVSVPLTITAYLGWLCEVKIARSRTAGAKRAAEEARDQAADRFYNPPTERTGERGHGPDCRVYFRAFLDYVAEHNVIKAGMTRMQADNGIAGTLRGFVRWQYELCFIDALRNANPTISRYLWRPTRCPGQSVCVFMPRRMTGAERRRWLEESIPDVDMGRPGERQRIQSIIDSRLGIPLMLPIKDFDSDALDAEKALCVPNDRSWSDRSVAASIIDLCAKKISEGGYTQRQVFEGLGKYMRELFVRVVLENDITEHHTDTQLAQLFGVSKATFSRLLTDLRPGLQQILGGHPDFRDAVMAWKRNHSDHSTSARQARNGEREK